MSDYNIDDILSEVKKRREENEKELRAQVEPEAPAESEPVEITEEKEDSEIEEKAQTVAEEEPEEAELTLEELPVEEESEPEEEAAPAKEAEEAEEMTNLLELAEEEPAAKEQETDIMAEAQEQPQKDKAKHRKTLKIVIALLLVLIIAFGGIAAWVINGKLNGLVENSSNEPTMSETEWSGMKTLDEDFTPIQETEATELASLEDMVRTWYYNGTPCSSSHVLNVMLIGEDTRDEEISEEDTRADAAILASVNVDTKQIVLTSVLRDSWSYYETEPGDESTGHFGKLNEALSLGGLSAYLNAVEKLYKVDIDGYAIVNFDSFETIIDTLYGDEGITLELTSKEINEINNNPDTYGDVYIEKTFEGSSGEIQLTGEQALAYCRIRHIDSDGARADRQKTTIMKIFSDFKDAGNTKLFSLVNQLLPYAKTSFGKNEMLKIAKYALSQGWTNFDFKTQNYPEYRVTGGIYSDYNNLWIWKSDFPADAYYMQTRIYGKSSITLASLRVDTQKVRRKGFFKEGASATTATIRNEHYGEVTTMPPDEEEETTE